jgi:amidase
VGFGLIGDDYCMSDIAFKSAVELAQMIVDREIGCLELLEHYLDRVQEFNDPINAIVVLDVEWARVRAKEAAEALVRGEDWGPLHGVPMTCKESFNVAGLPTTFGIPDFKDNIADSDALSVQRLKAAGAVIFGTTNNPWNLERIPGGSSGGSAAALSVGLTGFEIGSDIGGSIRNPANFCGIFGHKPTWGLLPPRGHTPTGTLSQSDRVFM